MWIFCQNFENDPYHLVLNIQYALKKLKLWTRGECSCSKAIPANILGMHVVVCNLFIMLFLHHFFLDLKFVKIKIWRTKTKPLKFEVGFTNNSGLSIGDRLSPLSSLWVVQIYSVILEIFVDVYRVLDTSEWLGIGRWSIQIRSCPRWG